MSNESVFDVRILERNLEKGLISREEYEKYLQALDDAEGNSTTLQSEFVEGVFERAAAARRAQAASRQRDDVPVGIDEEE